MIDRLGQKLVKDGYLIQEALIFCESGREFWHSSVIEPSGSPISGGFAEGKLESRKIAIAEFLERNTFRDLSYSAPEVRARWDIETHPTACGFAAGFDKNSTILRSISESAERWVMSKWIDEQFYIEASESYEVLASLDPISKFFASQFDDVLFYEKNISIDMGGVFCDVVVTQTMGLKDDGIFPGSSGRKTGGSRWQHSLLESFRHLLAVRNNPIRDRFPDNRVHFFAQNSNIALAQINNAKRVDWPKPKIRLHRVEGFENGSYFVARTILDGWNSWTDGPVERFLY